MSDLRYVNPYRFRAREDGRLMFGVFPGRVMPMEPGLAAIVDGGTVDRVAVGASDAPWLEDEHFLLPEPLPTDQRFSSQLGFFSFWPGHVEQRQEMLSQASVGVLGLGSLGSQVSCLLAAAGVGRLVLCDRDLVEPSNLNRQVLYDRADIGRPKAAAAAEKLQGLNSRLRIDAHQRELLTASEMSDVVAGVDIVVRAIDAPLGIQFEVDRACHGLGIPSVGGGFVERWCVAGPFVRPAGPCLRCLSSPPSQVPGADRRVATFGPLTFWLSSYVAGDVIRHLAQLGEPWLVDRLLLLDGGSGRIRDQPMSPIVRKCPSCGAVHRDAAHGPAAVVPDDRPATAQPVNPSSRAGSGVHGPEPRQSAVTGRAGIAALPVGLAAIATTVLILQSGGAARPLLMVGEAAAAVLGTLAVRPRRMANGYLWGVSWALGLVVVSMGDVVATAAPLRSRPLAGLAAILLGTPVEVLLISLIGLAGAWAAAHLPV